MAAVKIKRKVFFVTGTQAYKHKVTGATTPRQQRRAA